MLRRQKATLGASEGAEELSGKDWQGGTLERGEHPAPAGAGDPPGADTTEPALDRETPGQQVPESRRVKAKRARQKAVAKKAAVATKEAEEMLFRWEAENDQYSSYEEEGEGTGGSASTVRSAATSATVVVYPHVMMGAEYHAVQTAEAGACVCVCVSIYLSVMIRLVNPSGRAGR